jgi:flavin-dependent dehydrogenase
MFNYQSAPSISRARLHAAGSVAEIAINPPGVGIARSSLDFELWSSAAEAGCDCRQGMTVEGVTRTKEGFSVHTATDQIASRAVIDASGRWSKLNAAALPNQDDHWIGLKAHFCEPEVEQVTAENGAVNLYFFNGGYCGVQPLGGCVINVCAMVRAQRAAQLKDVFGLDAALLRRSRSWTRLTDAVSTSPLVFRRPMAVRGGMLGAGDAAGFIDPFVGDGISLALRTGVTAAEALMPFWRGQLSLDVAAEQYAKEYQRRFAPALDAAGRLRTLLTVPARLQRLALAMMRVPLVGRYLLNATR